MPSPHRALSPAEPVTQSLSLAAVRGRWPSWVPQEVYHYLAHVEFGAPLRELARAAGVHASTIMRQVRRIEGRRDEPLIDAALRSLCGGSSVADAPLEGFSGAYEVKSMMSPPSNGESGAGDPPDEEMLNREALRILRRMCETGAVLAVVPDMEKAVVVRETPTGSTQRMAVVETSIAQAMALKDWIACKTPGRIARYAITSLGRTIVSQLMAEAEQRRASQIQGLADAATPFDHGAPGTLGTPRPRRVRYGMAETPLSVLGRRRGRDGTPFLRPELVSAGERLREDFELAQMEPSVAQDWSAFLASGARPTGQRESGVGAHMDARRRLEAAFADLGPGLGDVTLRCCCHLEGLEGVERELGWAARSGKVVLRIALERLALFYKRNSGDGLIG